MQTNNLDTPGLSGSTSSRKDTKDTHYAAKTIVLEGIQGTALSDDEYEFEGKDIEYFGQLFESPKPIHGIDKVVNYTNLSMGNFMFTTSLNKIHEPSTYAEAVNDIRWVEAINQEIEALNRTITWEITHLPNNKNPIGSKWIFKVKYKANGEVERYKMSDAAVESPTSTPTGENVTVEIPVEISTPHVDLEMSAPDEGSTPLVRMRGDGVRIRGDGVRMRGGGEDGSSNINRLRTINGKIVD
nr:ribonuclease H-like domain-containing protein [Tanacetum cinerariifolium]